MVRGSACRITSGAEGTSLSVRQLHPGSHTGAPQESHVPAGRNPGLWRVSKPGALHPRNASRQGEQVGALGWVAGETSHGQRAHHGELQLMAGTSWLHRIMTGLTRLLRGRQGCWAVPIHRARQGRKGWSWQLYKGGLAAPNTLQGRAEERKEVLDQEPKEPGKGFSSHLLCACLLVVTAA